MFDFTQKMLDSTISPIKRFLLPFLLGIALVIGLSSCIHQTTAESTIARGGQSVGNNVITIINGQKAADSDVSTDLTKQLDIKSFDPLQAQMLKSSGELNYLPICGSPPPLELTLEPSKVTISEEQIERLPPYKRKAARERQNEQQQQDKQRIEASKLEIASFNRQVEASIVNKSRNCHSGDLLKAYNRASISLTQPRNQSSVPPSKYLLLISNRLSFYQDLAKIRCPNGVDCALVAASRPKELDPKFQLFSSTSSALKSITSKIAKN